ncbi:hypothetical protein K438DRAFT_1784129 [Mycena galopus ATCC 62051]|nr:hypothetical protein K438DRAFT_1784129 [Mycena galopus ATCC 62051]
MDSLSCGLFILLKPTEIAARKVLTIRASLIHKASVRTPIVALAVSVLPIRNCAPRCVRGTGLKRVGSGREPSPVHWRLIPLVPCAAQHPSDIECIASRALKNGAFSLQSSTTPSRAQAIPIYDEREFGHFSMYTRSPRYETSPHVELPPLSATLKYLSKHAHLFPATTVRQVYRTGTSASPLPPPLAPSPNSVSELMCRGLSAAVIVVGQLARPGKAERGRRHQAKVVNEAGWQGGGKEEEMRCDERAGDAPVRRTDVSAGDGAWSGAAVSRGAWEGSKQHGWRRRRVCVPRRRSVRRSSRGADEVDVGRCARFLNHGGTMILPCLFAVSGCEQRESAGEVAWSHSSAILLQYEKERREKVVRSNSQCDDEQREDKLEAPVGGEGGCSRPPPVRDAPRTGMSRGRSGRFAGVVDSAPIMSSPPWLRRPWRILPSI